MTAPSKLSDEELVVAVREKDKDLYAEIIRRYQIKLAHYLRKFISHPDELEDVLQEVFIKVYRNLNDFDISRKFSSWIYRIAHNEALNHLKKYRKELIAVDSEELQIMDDKLDVANIADRNLLKIDVRRALSMLKLKYRDPIILYFFEQKSYEEISDILHLPKNTVGTLIARGKSELKNFLIASL
ncbi:MAG: hypothetical protein A2538_01920 [Candidatus Magasanikbacteria bacterium RIFOXYD2_FULL_41_14]|uniref:RNA polymerase sigma factor n=1 Tax=Candidatus Magasanikbacteria bacterium RIFOXYD2_FULL_41_14 TaxID=1798709 RepID=A0A1F6PDV3_9BACT|nr:MAG: hypothetical protein A2538_01920 [Candidatus Magasanikbacteria bacterium RIFOXYD2_FULL_41_14]